MKDMQQLYRTTYLCTLHRTLHELLLWCCRKHTLNCHRMRPALFQVLCEIKEKTGKQYKWCWFGTVHLGPQIFGDFVTKFYFASICQQHCRSVCSCV